MKSDLLKLVAFVSFFWVVQVRERGAPEPWGMYEAVQMEGVSAIVEVKDGCSTWMDVHGEVLARGVWREHGGMWIESSDGPIHIRVWAADGDGWRSSEIRLKRVK